MYCVMLGQEGEVGIGAQHMISRDGDLMVEWIQQYTVVVSG